ncbi:hypothetical protein A5N17_07000 [Arthrobacter sp. D2]|nr:hypothetical protein [Paenarthrobacter ureafaciens]ERI35790.2 hypothetical protein M707_20095 [Arthrobacter sp. AK-YN10]NKR13476.1 hypothetical protein [Arthrobacter sp. M5]NKR17205.1 hypothetical protein [Arthrobacter sp. M6]OEH61883.1 hypothetical protein A5N13_16020 [Arthrobacter sp. D4]OEH64185.1 hypothetical protein A5N17_07000 [Arthrobacter sp. D2]
MGEFFMSNSPKILVLLLLIVSVSGVASCAANPDAGQLSGSHQVSQLVGQNSNDAYADIAPDQIRQAGTEVDFLWDPKDPFYGFNKYPVVARVHIDSIDGGRTSSPVSEQPVFPQTFGKMSVREVYKGDLTPGTQLAYSRVGGTVTYDDYWNSLNKEQQEKILQLNRGQKPTDSKYVQAKITDDIDIEVGKEYVALLLPQASKDNSHSEYAITGYQFGLREIRGTGSDSTILNNETHAWEGLSTMVEVPSQR